MDAIHIVDSHTGGEPTRIIVSGTPALEGSMADIRAAWQADHDRLRAAVVNEPRGSDVLVGGALYPPVNPDCAAGVLFFNNVGYLGMCGHGAIGLVVTLAHLGRIGPGTHRIETPVGEVTAALDDQGRVTIRNVPAYRHLHAQPVELADGRVVTGDVAWGGNWFFLCEDHGELLTYARREALRQLTLDIKQAIDARGLTGRDGAEIDHVELTGPGIPGISDGRNFVLCPGGAYDRSPCGTGTSAKLACLIADGKIPTGRTWRQAGISGSVFEVRGERDGDDLIPILTGSAHVTGEGDLFLDPADPFCWGIREPDGEA